MSLSFRSDLFIKASTAFIPIPSPTLSSSGPEAVLSLVYMYIYIIYPGERGREGGREEGLGVASTNSRVGRESTG